MTTVHLIACVAAIIAGAIVVLRPKGTAAHRALGSVYVGATFLYCGSSFFMYPSTGRLTPFHLIALQNLFLVSCGVALPHFLRQRLADWYAWHLRLMLYSYVALVATGSTIATTAAGWAPSAIRMPISDVRRVTKYASIP